MFCKWCGETIQATDVNCPNCGRETPPMSDCGGFYNLKTPDTGAQPGGNPPTMIVKNCPVVEKLESKYVHDRRADKVHHKLTVVFFSVMALLLVLSLVVGVFAVNKTEELVKKMSTMQRDMANFEELLVESTQPVETLPEPTTIPAPEEIIPEEIIPEETESLDETKSISVSEEINELGEPVFKVQYHNPIEIFADGAVTYMWQYSKEVNVWQNVAEDLLQMGEDGMSTFVCTEAFLKEIDAQEQQLEFRCVIQCENESGDTMEICVGGMTIGEKTQDTVPAESVIPETIETNDSEL